MNKQANTAHILAMYDRLQRICRAPTWKSNVSFRAPKSELVELAKSFAPGKTRRQCRSSHSDSNSWNFWPKRHAGSWAKWNYREPGKKSQRSNISILAQTHFSEHSGTKLLEFEIRVCSETLPHLAIQDDQKRMLHILLRNISTFMSFKIWHVLQSHLSHFDSTLCQGFAVIVEVGWHPTGTLRWSSMPMTPWRQPRYVQSSARFLCWAVARSRMTLQR